MATDAPPICFMFWNKQCLPKYYDKDDSQ